MSGHTYTHTYIHTYTHDNYSNPRCACAPRVNNVIEYCLSFQMIYILSFISLLGGIRPVKTRPAIEKCV